MTDQAQQTADHPAGGKRALLIAAALIASVVAVVTHGPDDSVDAADPSLVAVSPARVLETRSGPGNMTIDGLSQGVGRVAAGSDTPVMIRQRGGVSSTAAAVVANIAVINPSGPGFITIYPCGTPRPIAASANFAGSDVRAKFVLSQIATDGTICIYSSAETHLALDVSGYLPAGGWATSLTPSRVVESRTGPSASMTIDGQVQGGGVFPANQTIPIPIAGRAGIPLDAAAVFLDVVAVRPVGPGFITVFPCGAPVPNAASVNFGGGDVVSNAVLATVGTSGQVCLRSSAATDVVIDVTGYAPAGTPTISPARLLETRTTPGLATIDGQFLGTGAIPMNAPYSFNVPGRGGVSTDADAAFLNVVVVNPTQSGYLTVFPAPCATEAGSAAPNAASLTFKAGEVTANAVLAKVGVGGLVCVQPSVEAHVVVDVTGFVAAPPTTTTTTTVPPVPSPSFFGFDVSALLRLDTGTRTATAIGPPGAPSKGGLATSPTGTLYAATNSPVAPGATLVTIDATTGVETTVAVNSDLSSIAALEFNAAGVLYGTTFFGGFVTVDTSTGAITMIGTTVSGGPHVQDLALDGSGKLYGALFDPGNPMTGTPGSRKLVTIDTATGAATEVAVFSVPNPDTDGDGDVDGQDYDPTVAGVEGIAFDSDGTLFGGSCRGHFFNIDVANAQISNVKSYSGGGPCFRDMELVR